MKLIAGLGNYGKDYKGSRHNAGFIAVRWLAKRWQEEANWTQSKQRAFTLKSTAKDTLLAQPTTMMNESGRAVRALMDYYKINAEDVIIIHDDADLEVGQIKAVDSTQTGAGHHGILSVIKYIGPGFKRIRIGIGRPEQHVRDISDYVLGRLGPKEKNLIVNSLEESLEDLLSR